MTIVFFAGIAASPRLCAGDVQWHDPAWNHRQKLTISEGFYVTGSDLADFPVLVHITDENNPVFTRARKSGADIIFTSADGVSVIPSEIEKFSAGEEPGLICWVAVPTLYPDEDTVIYMYYGNPAGRPALHPHNVWDEGYRGVYHFTEEPDGDEKSVRDSTRHGRHGTADGYFIAPGGKIGGAVRSRVSFDPEIGPEFSPEVPFTIEAWVFLEEFPEGNTAILSKGTSSSGFLLWWHAATRRWQPMVYRHYTEPDKNIMITAVDREAAGRWRHVAIVYDAGAATLHLYVDGIEKAKGTNENLGDFSSRQPLVFNGAVGMIDEVRISSSARSSDWIMASYTNQDAPMRRIAVGPEEDKNDAD